MNIHLLGRCRQRPAEWQLSISQPQHKTGNPGASLLGRMCLARHWGPGGPAEPLCWTDGHGVREVATSPQALGFGAGTGVWAGLELGFGPVWSLAPGFECRGAELAVVPRLAVAACSWWRVKSLLGWEMPPPD